MFLFKDGQRLQIAVYNMDDCLCGYLWDFLKNFSESSLYFLRCGRVRTQILRSPLPRTQTYQRFCLLCVEQDRISLACFACCQIFNLTNCYIPVHLTSFFRLNPVSTLPAVEYCLQRTVNDFRQQCIIWMTAIVDVFGIFWRFVSILGKHSADSNLIFGTILRFHADLCHHFAIRWHQFSES